MDGWVGVEAFKGMLIAVKNHDVKLYGSTLDKS